VSITCYTADVARAQLTCNVRLFGWYTFKVSLRRDKDILRFPNPLTMTHGWYSSLQPVSRFCEAIHRPPQHTIDGHNYRCHDNGRRQQ
jgi:hypothetical protein